MTDNPYDHLMISTATTEELQEAYREAREREGIKPRGTIETAQLASGQWMVRVWHPWVQFVGNRYAVNEDSRTFYARRRNTALRRAHRWDRKHRPTPPLQQEWQPINTPDGVLGGEKK